MRITGGRLRGRKLLVVKGLPVRPTTDRTREALFSMLEHHLGMDEIKVLDLFCGTGIISLEAISREAAIVTAVDKSRKCIQALKQVKKEWDLENLQIKQSDALLYLKQEVQSYDLIFMDPPYSYEGINALLDQIFLRKLLLKEGYLVVEHDPHRKFDTRRGFQFQKVYGSSALSFFQISN